MGGSLRGITDFLYGILFLRFNRRVIYWLIRSYNRTNLGPFIRLVIYYLHFKSLENIKKKKRNFYCPLSFFLYNTIVRAASRLVRARSII